jgi:hypothetical protein
MSKKLARQTFMSQFTCRDHEIMEEIQKMKKLKA